MKRSSSGRTKFLLPLLLASPCLPDVSPAEEADSGVAALEEIVITAQKHAQDLQDVGISVTAISGDQLTKLGMRESTDLVQQVPSLQFQSTTTFATFNIRGVSQTEFTDQHELPVAVVVDGVYLSSPGAVQTQMFDLDHVEVLRGPQGTLFGRNSTGGMVQFVTKKPTIEKSGYADAHAGSYGETGFDGAIGGALSGEKLLGRVAVSFEDHDGYLKNRLGAATLGARVYAGRGQLLFQPSEDLHALLKVQVSKNDHERNGGYVWNPAAPNSDGLGVHVGPNENPWGTCNGCDLLGYRNPSRDPYDQAFDTQGYFDRLAHETSLTVDWNTPVGTLTSVTDYYSHDKDYLEDTDASPNPLFKYATAHQLDQFSQEVRLSSPANSPFWTVGAYFLNINSRMYQSLAFNFGPGVDFFGYDRRKDETRSIAAFAQTELPLNNRLKLVAGARWTSDRKRLDAVHVDPFGDGTVMVFNASTIGNDAKHTYDLWQGKLQLEWRPATDVLLFAGVSRGAKAGGFQGNLVAPQISFAAEKLTDYEAGFKFEGLDHRLRLNGSMFYYDYKDYQAFEFNQTTLASVVENLPARMHGGELELFAQPTRNFQFGLGLSVLDTVGKGVTLPSGHVVDRDMPQAPGTSVNGLARYSIPLAKGTLALQADFKYTGDFYFTVNNAPVEREPAYLISNARISYELPSGWNFAVYGKNLGNRYYRVYALDVSGLGFSNDRPGVPRWFGVEARYSFGGR